PLKAAQLSRDIIGEPRVICNQRKGVQLLKFRLNGSAFERWLHDRIAGRAPLRGEVNNDWPPGRPGLSDGFRTPFSPRHLSFGCNRWCFGGAAVILQGYAPLEMAFQR